MNKERLLDVVAVLRDVPDARFDMDHWANATTCGTVGCAVGHYCLARSGRGLWLSQFSDPEAKDVSGNLIFGFRAIAEHFDIDFLDVYFLFTSSNYPDPDNVTRADVIRRIEAFVARGGAA